jgi:putative ABC transport system ATP-binding protein
VRASAARRATAGQAELEFAARAFTAVVGVRGSDRAALARSAAGPAGSRGRPALVGGTGRVLLLPWLTVEQNLTLRARLGSWLGARLGSRPRLGLGGRRANPPAPAAARTSVRALLDLAGLAGRAGQRAGRLSRDERRRVAMVGALTSRPGVIFAEDPTAALGDEAGQRLLALLRHLVDEEGRTVVMATQDPAAACHADRVVFLAGGRVATSMTDLNAPAVARVMADLARELALAATAAR